MAQQPDGSGPGQVRPKNEQFKRKPLLKRLSLNWEPDIEDVKDGLTVAYDDDRTGSGQQPVHDRARS